MKNHLNFLDGDIIRFDYRVEMPRYHITDLRDQFNLIATDEIAHIIAMEYEKLLKIKLTEFKENEELKKTEENW